MPELTDWVGDGMAGEVVTTGPLYGRAAPSQDAQSVILWAAGERLIRWCVSGEWVLVQSVSRTERTAAWSHREFLREV